jgi:hypothetical protein
MGDTSTFTGFQQYGAVGGLAVGLLSLFALIFKQLIANLVKRDELFQGQHLAQTAALVEIKNALVTLDNTIKTSNAQLTSEIREVRIDLGVSFNQLATDTRKYGSPPEIPKRLPGR